MNGRANKPTAGTWEVRQSNSDGTFGIVTKRTVVALGICNLMDARIMASAKELLDACKKALWESSLNDSPTVLSEKAHKALNDAVLMADGATPIAGVLFGKGSADSPGGILRGKGGKA